MWPHGNWATGCCPNSPSPGHSRAKDRMYFKLRSEKPVTPENSARAGLEPATEGL